MLNKKFKFCLVLFLAFFFLACSDDSKPEGGGKAVTPKAAVDKLSIWTLSSDQIDGIGVIDEEEDSDVRNLQSADEEMETGPFQKRFITTNGRDDLAVVVSALDRNNAAIPGVKINFSTTAGRLQYPSVVTGSDGNAVNILYAGYGEKENKTIMVTARSDNGKEISIPVVLSGTKLIMSDLNPSISPNVPQLVTLRLLDGGDEPLYNEDILVTSSGADLLEEDGRPFSEKNRAVLVSDLNGVVKFNIKGGSLANSASVSAEALGASAKKSFRVDDVALRFISPSEDRDIKFINSSTREISDVEVYTSEFLNLTFYTSLGSWDKNLDLKKLEVIPSGNKARARLYSYHGSDNPDIADITPGLATITIVAEDSGGYRKAQISRKIAVANEKNQAQVRKIKLETGSSRLLVSGPELKNQITLTAIVTGTSDEERISGVPVKFSMEGGNGGGEYIESEIVYTDSQGKALTHLTSGSLTTGASGIIVTASTKTLFGDFISASEGVIIGNEKAGSIAIGRALYAREGDKLSTFIQLPVSVMVTDSRGNPVKNQDVSLSLRPLYYDDRDGVRWEYGNDSERKGVKPTLSSAGSVPHLVKTDELGVAYFDHVYLKEYATYLGVELKAQIFGMGMSSILVYGLPALKDDVDNGSLPPSPFPDFDE